MIPLAVAPLGPIVRILARFVAGRATERTVEEITGTEVMNPVEKAVEVAEDLLGRQPETVDEAEQAVRQALDRGEISRRDLERFEQNVMTDFNTFMSIGLEQCGSDRETFGDLVEVWNQEKDEIRGMTAADVRQNLRCP